MNELFQKYDGIGLTQTNRNQMLETINGNINWMNKYKEIVGNWLKDHSVSNVSNYTFFKKHILFLHWNLRLESS